MRVLIGLICVILIAAAGATESGAFKASKQKLDTHMRKCSPKSVTCKDGSSPFSKVNRGAGTPNGCGASGSALNDKILGGLFTPCCNNHDVCYGSAGSVKDSCDSNFYNCMWNKCSGLTKLVCQAQAAAYYQAVSQFGCGAFEGARVSQGCLSTLLRSAPNQGAAVRAWRQAQNEIARQK
jgi:secretory phospholipase A2